MPRDYSRLLSELSAEYAERSPRSREVNDLAGRYLVDGGSHTIRLLQPFPPRIVAAKGARVTDEDGHQILDFWQGHLANVLGHNPEVVTKVMTRCFVEGFGLQTGFTDRLQAETAEILCRRTGAERVRFTTSGALGTMYAIMLARAFTGRTTVLKVGGGWHGAQPWGLKGVGFQAAPDRGFVRVESEGIPQPFPGEVQVTGFNDPQRLEDCFRAEGEKIACFIVEPFIGAGGLIAAGKEYLQAARDLTLKHGAILIFDEVISGFRFRAGDAGSLWGIRPDLAVFGKVIGGGMPVSAVAGRADVLGLVSRAAGQRVRFSGGTYSAHPASLLAARTLLNHLVENEARVYPRLAELGAMARSAIERAFVEEGILARCTGGGEGILPGSSLFMVHFPHREDARLERPEDVYDPELCDVALGEKVLHLALLLEDVHLIHAHGGVSTAHCEEDIVYFNEACRRAARRIHKMG